MSVANDEAAKVVGSAYIKGAREAGKEDARAGKDKQLDPRAQQVKDLIDAAVANPGVGVAITVYRRGTGTLRTEEKWIGVIDYVSPMDLKTWGIEAIVEDYSGGGAYRCVIKVPQLEIDPTEVYFSVDGKPLPPKPKREQAAAMGVTVEQLIAQESGSPLMQNRFGPVGPGTPQMGGLPAQQMGMQPGYGMQQPYGYPQVHMGGPYGGYHQQGLPLGQNNPFNAYPMPQQPPQQSAQDKLLEKLADRALNPPTVQKDDEENETLKAVMKMVEEQNRRWERSEEQRREAEERRREREDNERRWQTEREQHAREVREMEMRHEKEREEQRRRDDERRWREQLEMMKGDKNPTLEMIGALAPVASGLIQAFGSKEDASIKLMEIMMARPTNEDRIAKLSEILGNNMATNVGLVGTILTNVLADKAGEDRPAWLDVLMQLIDQGGDVAKVALGGMMGDEEDEEAEEVGEGRRSPPPGMQAGPRRPTAPPGMQAQAQGAATAADAARQRIAAAHAQMERMRQAQAAAPPAQEGQVIDVPSTSRISIQKFDSAMQTIFSMISGSEDPHEIAFLLWKHAASGVRPAVEWFNHGIEASQYLLGALRSNDELTVSDERIAQVGTVIRDLYEFMARGGSPEEYVEKHNIQRSLPKSTRIDPVRGRMVQSGNKTTASLDGQGQAQFGEGQAEVVKSTGGEIKGRDVEDIEEEATPELPADQNPLAKKPKVAVTSEPDPDALSKQVAEMTAKAQKSRASQTMEPQPTQNPALAKKPPKAKPAADAPKGASKKPQQGSSTP